MITENKDWEIIMSKNNDQTAVIKGQQLFFCCWLAAWEIPYIGKPWRLNHFVVKALNQQQHSSYLNLKKANHF